MNYFNYFSEIEDTFIRRRGKSLLLSPIDWALIETWKESKIPLHIVLRAIEQIFDRIAQKPHHRSVKSLIYCREEVEIQFAEWRERQIGKSDDETAATEADSGENQPNQPFEHQTVLEHLAEASESLRANDSPLALMETFLRVAARLDELKDDFATTKQPNAEFLEESLSSLEGLLDEALQTNAPPQYLEILEKETAKSLQSHRKTMSKESYQKTFDLLLIKKLRDKYDVPRLSLFYI